MRWLPILLLPACFQGDKDDTATHPPDDTTTEAPDDTGPPVDADGDGYAEDEDCDDTDPDVHPGAEEVCNEVDDDCDDAVDEDATDATTWHVDEDGDGWGSPDTEVAACEQPSDAVSDGTDCDDTDASIHPEAEELCDGVTDQDCDGEVDDDCGPAPQYLLEGADVMILGEGGGDKAGYSVAGVGDSNGDGFVDLLIGAPDADDGLDEYKDKGAAYLLLGPLTGDFDLNVADAEIIGIGYMEDDNNSDVGKTVAGAGDTNGDGFADLLVADPNYYTDLDDDDSKGFAALFLGPVEGEIEAFDADALLYGSTYDGHVGCDLAAAGDTDGDGFADVLVVAGSHSSTGDGGAAYLFMGPIAGERNVSHADGTVVATYDEGGLGSAVSGVGDVDGDGLDDVLLGAQDDSALWNQAGSAYLFLSPLEGHHTTSDAQLQLHGEYEHHDVGRSLDGAGDIDGDGYDDVMVGSNGEPKPIVYGGEVYILFGGSSGGSSGAITASDADAILYGGTDYLMIGSSVAGAGDIDGDGRAEILVGTTSSEIKSTAGSTWLVHGPISGVADIENVASVRFLGTSSGDKAGTSVAFAGDMDADGIDDILIGAPGEDSNGSGAGAAYLIYGSGL